jgi:hypothetical protein
MAMTIKISEFLDVTLYGLMDVIDDSEKALLPSLASRDFHPDDRDSTFLRD